MVIMQGRFVCLCGEKATAEIVSRGKKVAAKSSYPADGDVPGSLLGFLHCHLMTVYTKAVLHILALFIFCKMP